MKTLFIEFQDKLMDIIIVSLIVMIGMLSIIGFVFSLIIAYIYLNKNIEKNWKNHFDFKIFLQSIFLEVIIIATGLVLYMNYQIVPQLTTLPGIIVFVLTTLMSIFLFINFIVIIWLVARGKKLKRETYELSISLLFIGLPIWFIYILIFLISGIVLISNLALIILLIGFNLVILNFITEKQYNKVTIFLEENHL